MKKKANKNKREQNRTDKCVKWRRKEKENTQEASFPLSTNHKHTNSLSLPFHFCTSLPEVERMGRYSSSSSDRAALLLRVAEGWRFFLSFL